MKKSFISVLLVVCVAGFGACGKKDKSSEKEILEFWVGDVKYDINGTNISKLYSKFAENQWTGWVTMPVAPSKVRLSSGATINPPITEKRDFEAGVAYTVTAEDGSQQIYKVKAERTQNLN